MNDDPDLVGCAVPADHLPPDAIRVQASDVQVMLAPAADRTIDVGLLLELPPPLGTLRVSLTPEQVSTLHTKLATLLALDDRQVAELLDQIHHTQPETE